MPLDMHTILIAAFVVDFFMGGVFYLQHRLNRDIPGVFFWTIGFVGMALGLCLLLLREQEIGPFFHVLLSNFLLAGGISMITVGVAHFLGRPCLWKWLAPPGLLFISLIVIFTYEHDSTSLRIIFFSVFVTYVMLLGAWMLFRYLSADIRSSALFTAWLLVLCAVLMFLRGIVVGVDEPVVSLFQNSGLQQGLLFLSLVFHLLLALGLFFLINQRLVGNIQEMKGRFEQIFYASPESVSITRVADSRYVEVNEGFTHLTGYHREDVLGLKTDDLRIWVEPQQRVDLLQSLLTQGGLRQEQVKLRNREGHVMDVIVSARIIQLDGQPHLLAVSRDITAMKEQEQSMQRYNEQLRDLNATKDKFFSIIAHDLRSPLSGAMGISEELYANARNFDQDTLVKLAEALKNALSDSFNLLSNLLEWSRIQRGLIVPRYDYVSLSALVREIVSLSVPSARAKGLQLHSHVPVPMQVYTDSDMLHTILRNLLSNAVKYSHEDGAITISAEQKHDGISISVKDNGVGISPERLHNLFLVDKSESTRGTAQETGTGLGLVLCHELIHRMDGEITVSSKEGEGTCFTVVLPLVKAPKTAASPVA